MQMKDPQLYEEKKKKDAMRKKLERVQKKCSRQTSNNTENAEVNQIPSPVEPSPGPSKPVKIQLMSSFKHQATKCRSLSKVSRNLPKSPNKRSEIIRSLAKRFQVDMEAERKKGRPKLILNDAEKDWLKNFFDRPDISYTTPGRRDQVYIGKVWIP